MERDRRHESFYEEGVAALLRARDDQLPSLDNTALQMPDDAQSNSRKRQRTEDSLEWQYVSVSKLLNEDDEYYSSCDEMENDYHSDEYGLPFISSDSDEPRRVVHVSKSKADSECFLCSWVSKKGIVYPLAKINKLVSILQSNYGNMNNMALAKILHQYFKDEIWPFLDKSLGVVMWRTKTALRHIEEHTLDPNIHIGETIKKFKKISTALEQKIFKTITNQNGEQITVPDVKAIKSLTELEKTVREVYRTPPNSMNFYSESSKIEFSSIGNHVNLNKQFSIDE